MKPFSTLTSSLSTAFFSFNVWCKFTADKATPAKVPTPMTAVVACSTPKLAWTIGIGGSGFASSIPEIEDGGFFGGIGIGAAVGAALLVFTGLGIIPVILGGLAAGVGGGLGWSWLDGDAVKDQIKQKVCELGFEKFDESAESILGKIQEKIIAGFEERIEANSGLMKKAILRLENLLEQQEQRERQTQEQCDAEKVWIENKQQELQQVQKQIEVILNQSVR